MQSAINLVYKYKARTVSELYDKCTSDEFASMIYNSENYHKTLLAALEIFIKDSLELQRRNRWEYLLSFSAPNMEEEREILRLFQTQNIDPVFFAECLKSVLMCERPKINSFKIHGVPNSGKTLIAQLICQPFISCYANNHGSENEFFMSNFLNKSLILCEELYITQATCEDFKSILGGVPIDICKKHQEKQIWSRTPVIITSNFAKYGRGHLSAIDETALSLRGFTFEFNQSFVPKMLITLPSFAHFLFLCCNQDML